MKLLESNAQIPSISFHISLYKKIFKHICKASQTEHISKA